MKRHNFGLMIGCKLETENKNCIQNEKALYQMKINIYF